MKTIRRFGNVAEAGFARSVLHAAGIQAALADEHAYTLGPQYAPWGIRLQVPEPDADRAARVLDQQEGFLPLPDDFVPPPEPMEAGGVSPRSTGTAFGAFFAGGCWGLLVIGALATATLLAGGNVHGDAGGILFVFALGGMIGLVVRGIYAKGRRDQAGEEPNG